MTGLEGFIHHLKVEDRSKHTVAGYKINLGMFVRWFESVNGQPAALARVTPLDVMEYRRYLLAQNKAPGTINQKLSYLRGFFDWCMTQGLITTNPASKIKLIQQGQRRPKWLARHQVYALLRTAQETIQLAELRGNQHKIIVAKRTYAMMALMLHAGLRVSEVCDLQRGDIVLGERAGKVIVRQGKGRKYREVPLNVDVRKALAGWLDVWTGHTYLFDNLETARRLHVRTVQIAVTQLARRAGIENFTPHHLRHTFGKTLIDMGESLDKVAVLMGHSSLDTTAVYTLPSEADLQRAVELIAWSD